MSGELEVRVRRMEEGDLVEVERIQEGSEGASRWRVEEYLGYEGWVGEVGGRVVGFCVVRESGGGEAEVLNVAVDGEWRRRGVGRRMLAGCGLERFEEVYLEVRESNEGARGLYRALGFREDGVRRNYYEGPREAGIVMKLQKW